MRAVLGVSLGVAVVGCGSAQRQIQLTIRPSTDMNESRSCYVLARAIDDKAFATESYDDVAAKAMAPDESVLSSIAVLPGVEQKVTLPVPEKGRIAVYALYRQPADDSWRLLLLATPPEKMELRLMRARMCWASEDRSRGAAGACGTGGEGRR
ncbi:MULTISPECIES: type VI secretion lipoprotein TssJ [Sorangium]|uniref:type VI secretion lipoprotein TssJ n=1 Tax=Sorangium TaxID=39643 RepID=UPI0013EB4EFC|nr:MULTISPECIES: type VI secretion lipoprotein TssJ [Sorangium]